MKAQTPHDSVVTSERSSCLSIPDQLPSEGTGIHGDGVCIHK